MDGFYREPLINLKVGLKVKKVNFLVDSRAARSSLTIPPHPPPRSVSLFRTALSFWVMGEEFSVPIF
jgi:hypothetical protein